MDKPLQNVRSIFDEASEISDIDARAVYVARACAGDPTLKRRVEELLRAHDTAGGFLQGADESRSGTLAGDARETIGRYQLLEKLGEGGCGIVYRAEQQEPVTRHVALKVIKLGMDTRSVIARFEAERQALAMMEHPNIARVLDAGATESGRPYFVMELVEGIRITGFCDRHNLSTTQRLELFIQVCHAVQHAHQKGVIHRDLKPSNILVSFHDTVAVPKVIDFGIAKATADLQLTDKTIFTHFELFLGTPAYMSPEQARMGGADIDTRSDIYSLGVLLYELLTGRPPFDGEQLLRSGIDALRHVICETDPTRPSTRLRQLSPDEQALVAGFRGTEAPRLVSSLRGDLDWIVLKALEKDRARRYESAGALAVDLRRHLDHEPVAARPPSGWDAFQKLVRRNRTFFFSALAAGLALVVGLAIATVLFFRERDARQRAVQAEQTQSLLRREADGARDMARAKCADARRQLVLLNVSSGNKLVANGDNHAALLWFVEAMRLERADPASEDVHRRRIASVRRFAPRLLHIGFLERPAGSAEFTSDGQRIIGIQEGGHASVWDVASGETLVHLAPYSFDFHRETKPARKRDAGTGTDGVHGRGPDPRPLFGVGRTSTGLVIRNLATGKDVQVFSAPTNLLHEVIVSADGRRAMAVAPDYAVYRWEAPGREPLEPSLQYPPIINHFSLSADGATFAATHGHHPADVGIWDFVSGRELLRLKRPAGDLFDCQLSSDGKLLATANWEGSARVFDVATGLPVGDLMHHGRGIGKSIFSPDGQILATASWDGTARLWNPVTGRPLSPWLHHAGYIPVATFSPDGTRLLTGGQDETVRLWDIATNQLARLALPAREQVLFATLSHDGTRFMTSGRDRSVKIWEMATGAPLSSNRLSAVPTKGGFSPDGQRLAIGCDDGRVRILDATSCSELFTLPAHDDAVRIIEFSPNSTCLLTASSDGVARMWDPTSGLARAPRLTHAGRIYRAEFSRDGRRIVTASHDHTAQVWDAATGARVGKAMPHICEVFWVALSPDGKRVVTAASDTTQLPREAQMWDAETGEPVGPALPHRDGVLFATFSPDGRWVVTTSEDSSAVVWSAATGAAVTPPMRHSSYIWRALFSPNSRYLLTVSMDKTARVWDATSGEPVTPPLPHEGSVSGGEWSPNGKEVFTFSGDMRARVWDVSPALEPLAELLREAELLSAHRLQLGLGMAPLTKSEIRQRWESSGRRP